MAVWGRDAMRFLSKFNPDVQDYCARNPERCFIADTPTLHDVLRAYGEDAAASWLDIQLTDLVQFSGVRKEHAATVIGPLAQVISGNYGFLKVSELMLFFQHFKCGKYGRFYGQFDPMVVTEALHDFLEYRTEQLSAIERRRAQEREAQRREQRRRQEAAGELMSREEWEEIKWLFNIGYEARPTRFSRGSMSTIEKSEL